MRTRVAHWAAVVVLLTALVAVPNSAEATPFVGGSTEGIDIHTLPGNSGSAVGIAANGWVATTYAVWTGSGYPVPVPVPAATGSNFAITDINDGGTVVGWYWTGFRRAFRWTPGESEITDIGTPPGVRAGAWIEATGIDDDGNIVGTFDAVAGICDATTARCGFYVERDDDGTYGPIDSIGAGPTGNPFTPLDLGGGLAVGPGWSWEADTGTFRPLEDPAGGTLASGVVVNESRQIAGHWIPTNGITEALFWPGPDGAPVRLGTLDTDTMSQARGIADDGMVVGWSGTTPTGARRAFAWNGTMTELGHIPGGATASSDAFDADGSLIVGRASGRAVIWDLAGGFAIDYPPEITVAAFVRVSAGESVTIAPQISDFEDDSFTVVCGGLPVGASCDAAGVITWQTDGADAGIYPMTITATQDDRPENTHTVGVTIEVINGVVLQPIGDRAVEAGSQLMFTAVATGATSPMYTYSPQIAGASLGASTGAFSWTPSIDQVGSHVITIRVDDVGTRTSDSETITITVTEESQPPPIQISVDESIAVLDDAGLRSSIVISIDESIALGDTVGVVPPMVIRVTEAVGVVDDVGVRLSVTITVTETVVVSDGVVVRGPVQISVDESIAITDGATLAEPLTISIDESIHVMDDPTVTASDRISAQAIREYVSMLDDEDFRFGVLGRMLFTRLLAAVERHVAVVDFVLRRVDGCGSAADRDDLIVDCAAQTAVRRMLILLREQMTSGD